MQYRYDNQKAYMAIHNMNKLDLRTLKFFIFCLFEGKIGKFKPSQLGIFS